MDCDQHLSQHEGNVQRMHLSAILQVDVINHLQHLLAAAPAMLLSEGPAEEFRER